MATLITPARPITIRPSEAIIAIHPSSPVVQVRPATVIPIRPVLLVPITPARSETVRPPNRGAWDERGWIRTRNGNNEIYEGEYQVGGRRFNNPPRAIRRHRHHACFQQVGLGTGWYLLHWSRSPRNVDEAILYFEQVLDESINM